MIKAIAQQYINFNEEIIRHLNFAKLKYSDEPIMESNYVINEKINYHKRNDYQDYYNFIAKFIHFTYYKCQEDNKYDV